MVLFRHTIVAAFGIVLYAILNRNVGSFITTAVVFAIVVFGIRYFMDNVEINEVTLMWVQGFFEEGSSIASNRSVEGTTASRLLFVDFILPDNLSDWIIGTGKNIFHNFQEGERSDIGFIRQLFYGGLIYLSLLLLFVYFVARRSRERVFKGFTALFLFTILVLNFKGNFLPATGGMSLFMLVYYYSLYAYPTTSKTLKS